MAHWAREMSRAVELQRIGTPASRDRRPFAHPHPHPHPPTHHGQGIGQGPRHCLTRTVQRSLLRPRARLERAPQSLRMLGADGAAAAPPPPPPSTDSTVARSRIVMLSSGPVGLRKGITGGYGGLRRVAWGGRKGASGGASPGALAGKGATGGGARGPTRAPYGRTGRQGRPRGMLRLAACQRVSTPQRQRRRAPVAAARCRPKSSARATAHRLPASLPHKTKGGTLRAGRGHAGCTHGLM
jgi:hypothetical protein